jgi:hypothetical protein
VCPFWGSLRLLLAIDLLPFLLLLSLLSAATLRLAYPLLLRIPPILQRVEVAVWSHPKSTIATVASVILIIAEAVEISSLRSERKSLLTSLSRSGEDYDELRAKYVLMERNEQKRVAQVCSRDTRTAEQFRGWLTCVLHERYSLSAIPPDDARLQSDLKLSVVQLMDFVDIVQREMAISVMYDSRLMTLRDAPVGEVANFFFGEAVAKGKNDSNPPAEKAPMSPGNTADRLD